MTLWIVRHGQTEANASGLLLGRADPNLNDVGRDQAKRIADAIPVPDLVIASPLSRTMQTADAFGQQIIEDDRFIEVDYGDYDLQPLSSVPPEIWKRWRSELDFTPPNGESMATMHARVVQGLAEVSLDAAELNIVIVSHVSPIKASLCWALNVGAETMWRTWVAQASISRVEVSTRGVQLHGFNAVGHLT